MKKRGWAGDYYTNQRGGCGGRGQPFAGFGWRSAEHPGIEDWGPCHPMNKILCEQRSYGHPTAAPVSYSIDFEAAS